MANVERYRHGQLSLVDASVDSDVAISKGDMLLLSTGKVIRASGATGNLTLYAIAQQAHAAGTAGTVDTIVVALVNPLATWAFALNASTAIVLGDNLQISGAQELTKSDTDSVARAVEAGTLTTVKVVFKSSVLFLGDLT